MAPLNIVKFGLTLGSIWGLIVFLLGIMSSVWHKGDGVVRLFGKVYIGFRSTMLGCLAGAAWGFVDGVISGICIAWIINLFLA